jgi:hypothetical protein
MRVMVMRVLAAAVGAFVLWTVWFIYANPFGYCTMAGCESYLSIDTGVPWFEGITYEVEVCLDDQCWEGITVANDSRDDDSGTIGLDSGGYISIFLGAEERATTSTVTVVVTADGVEVERYAGVVEYEVNQPNGRWCEPTCYFGFVAL